MHLQYFVLKTFYNSEFSRFCNGLYCMKMTIILKLYLSCSMTKPTKWFVRPAKTLISLGIHPPSLIRVCAARMKKCWVLSFLPSAQWRLWSDCTDVQADLSLCWAHIILLCCSLPVSSQEDFHQSLPSQFPWTVCRSVPSTCEALLHWRRPLSDYHTGPWPHLRF